MNIFGDYDPIFCGCAENPFQSIVGSVPLLSCVWLWNRFDTLFPGYAPALPDQWRSCGSWMHPFTKRLAWIQPLKMLRHVLLPSGQGILTLFQEFWSQLVGFYIQSRSYWKFGLTRGIILVRFYPSNMNPAANKVTKKEVSEERHYVCICWWTPLVKRPW